MQHESVEFEVVDIQEVELDDLDDVVGGIHDFCD